MLYEWGARGSNLEYTAPHPKFPSARAIGRRQIWGCLKGSCVSERASVPGNTITTTLQSLDLDNLTQTNEKLTEWDNNTAGVPQRYTSRAMWSPYPGETNIIYALCSDKDGGNVCRNSGRKYWLVTYNVDTGVETPIISYDPGDGTDVSDAVIIGFTKDVVTGSLGHQHEIVIIFNYEADHAGGLTYRIFTDHQPNGTFGNNRRRIKEYHPETCDARMIWYPQPHKIHGGVSPDGLYAMEYWGVFKNDFDGDACMNRDPFTINADRHWKDIKREEQQIDLTHMSWLASNDWYIGSGEVTGGWCTIGDHPNIVSEKIYQITFDRNLAETRLNDECAECFTHNLLIDRPSAAIWSLYGGSSRNYHAMPAASIRPDGRSLIFNGTNGKYTRDDKAYCIQYPSLENCGGGANGINTIGWEGVGTYIADLAPVSH